MAMTLAMEEMFESLAGEGYGGIIVVSGSGVMEEMAYFANLLWQHPAPLIFANLMVQGRAGVKEGLMNLHCAVRAALTEETQDMGVLLCSSGELFAADEVILADPLSPDNAFQAIEQGSLGKMLNGEIKYFRRPKRPGFLARRPQEIPCVEILWASLGGGELLLSQLGAAHELGGLVLAGFGAGNVPPLWIPQIRNIIRRRVPVAVVSRCLEGNVHKIGAFEGSFEKLIEMGVMSGGRLNPFQARIRMSLGLAAGLTENGLSHYMLGRPVSDDISTLYK